MNFFDLFRKRPVDDEASSQPKSEPKPESPIRPGEKDDKAHIYNLIIIDESGSMGHLAQATIAGVNETLNTIRQAQQEFADTQTHYLTLVTFDSPGRHRVPVRTIIDTKPISEVSDFQDYRPCGRTPLYDAMGQSINRLHQLVRADENASAIVTVMTDGLENSSKEYSLRQLKSLIEKLKEEGWTFNYMGSAHDVKSVCDLLSIENVVEFSHDEEGTRQIWRRERMAKRRFFEHLSHEWGEACEMAPEDKKAFFRKKSHRFYDDV